MTIKLICVKVSCTNTPELEQGLKNLYFKNLKCIDIYKFKFRFYKVFRAVLHTLLFECHRKLYVFNQSIVDMLPT